MDAYNDHYFLLDKTANVSHCKLVKEDGQYRRIYVGKVNETESGKPCLNWMTLNSTTANKYKTMMGIGDHNYCRNPGSAQNREFCYYSPTKWERCVARTCGKSKTAVHNVSHKRNPFLNKSSVEMFEDSDEADKTEIFPIRYI